MNGDIVLLPLCNSAEDHLGYLATGHVDDASMHCAITNHEQDTHGDSDYEIDRGYGRWIDSDDRGELETLDWKAEPAEGYEPMTYARYQA